MGWCIPASLGRFSATEGQLDCARIENDILKWTHSGPLR